MHSDIFRHFRPFGILIQIFEVRFKKSGRKTTEDNYRVKKPVGVLYCGVVYGGFTILAGGFAYLIYTLLVAGIVNPTRTLRNVFIQNAPSDPANLLVRPEVRGPVSVIFQNREPSGVLVAMSGDI